MFAITERLLLRPGWAEDAPALARALDDPAIARNLARVPAPYGVEDALHFLRQPADPRRPRFLICRRNDGALIGGIGLDRTDAAADGAELSYWIARPHWGQGLATEAGRAVCALADASLRLPRLLAAHALDNPASARVLAKLGFSAGARARLASLGRGEVMDVRRFTRDRRAPEIPALAA